MAEVTKTAEEIAGDNGYLLTVPKYRRFDYSLHKLVCGDPPGDVPHYSSKLDAAKSLLDYVRSKGNKSVDKLMLEWLVHHDPSKMRESDLASGICDCVLEAVGLGLPTAPEV